MCYKSKTIIKIANKLKKKSLRILRKKDLNNCGIAFDEFKVCITCVMECENELVEESSEEAVCSTGATATVTEATPTQQEQQQQSVNKYLNCKQLKVCTICMHKFQNKLAKESLQKDVCLTNATETATEALNSAQNLEKFEIGLSGKNISNDMKQEIEQFTANDILETQQQNNDKNVSSTKLEKQIEEIITPDTSSDKSELLDCQDQKK